MSARGLIVAALFFASTAMAQEIYKWTDAEGRVHFSNLPREGEAKSTEEKLRAANESAAADDPMRGFATRTQAAVNSVEFQLARKNRDLRRARYELERTRDDVANAERSAPARLPELRLRERRGTEEVARLEQEVSEMETQVAKLRALQALGEAESR